MGALLNLGAAALKGIFTKDKLVQTEQSLEAQRVLRPVPTGLAAAVALLALWHFVAWPVLNYLFPAVGFPPLTVDIIRLVPALLGM